MIFIVLPGRHFCFFPTAWKNSKLVKKNFPGVGGNWPGLVRKGQIQKFGSAVGRDGWQGCRRDWKEKSRTVGHGRV